jgi:hypothetical protein
MRVSRRDFLGAATASLVSLKVFRSGGIDSIGNPPEGDFDCVLIDLKSDCVLRESFQGYRAAVSDGRAGIVEVGADSRRHCRVAIVPGFGLLDSSIAQRLVDLLRVGAHLVMESGGAFLSRAGFAAHQRILDRYFDLTVEPPMDLWAAANRNELGVSRSKRYRDQGDSHNIVPYVRYTWPGELNVRDFSRIIPVLANPGEIIGRVGRIPVALKKRVGDGALIFLGSPLGPALLAGDPQARVWLQGFSRGVSLRDRGCGGRELIST